MPIGSHAYSDKSAGFILYRSSDGTHSHLHRVHTSIATIDNTTDPGSPVSFATLINPEGEVNRTARNFLYAISSLTPTTYALTLVSFQPVAGGVPTGAPLPLQPYSLTGSGGSAGPAEAQVTITFRDSEGAPENFVVFGGGSLWNPAVKLPLDASWGGSPVESFAAYITGLARTGAPAYPAGMTDVVSHNGKPGAIPLAVVSGLNNRLRREYRVK